MSQQVILNANKATSNGVKKLFLYNTLTRKKEEFKPIKKGKVGLYTCGLTVYNFAHIGNLRTYLFEDILKRVLLYNGYKVKHVMNITDVGHLTGDRDMGEDKLEKGAAREGKTAWEIAEFYTKEFKKDLERLNIIEPDIWCKATDHIKEQIELIKKLEKRGYTYKISDGIYFDTSKVKDYNKLSHQPLEKLRAGARVEVNEEKKNPTDFALWKFSPAGEKRQMEWPSPWGVGFPGWHIECSAMSMKYLGEQFDIHCGGVDHINIHHTNEIAQAESATGKKPWVKYWLHGEFLNISGGEKMAKSQGNFLTLENALIKKGINPLVYRFAVLQTHYRKPMEYSEGAIKNAEKGLKHLYNQARELTDTDFYQIGGQVGGTTLHSISPPNKKFKDEFLQAVNDDLNTPQALAVVQKVFKSSLADEEKLGTIIDFDKVFGLNIEKELYNFVKPENIEALINEREKARKERNFKESDRLRKEIEKKGYRVEDTEVGMRFFKK
ncbi:MAG: cysteine--tRNA ligase [Patescibacteria group bacterium]|nr:cysteine--tRNA ligase [Patescibacteria group bacterium]MDD5554781.1 cysteine--tRNA ligase [Patescibacteria group bacterium]